MSGDPRDEGWRTRRAIWIYMFALPAGLVFVSLIGGLIWMNIWLSSLLKGIH